MYNVEKLQTADVLCSKSDSFVSRTIGWSFDHPPYLDWTMTPDYPHSHNGLLYVDRFGDHFVFEAISEGLVLTPLRDYAEACKRGEYETYWLRLKGGLSHADQATMAAWMRGKILEGVKYDYLSYLSHVWRYAFKFAPFLDTSSESKFYCTEACQAAYKWIAKDPWKKNLPAPITTEKRFSEGKFVVIDHWKEI